VKKKSLPIDVIDQWPEIFNEVDVRAVPLAYLDSVNINFKDGKIWEISVSQEIKMSNDFSELEQHLQELVKNYEENIEKIDFKLDIDRVKKDVIKTTKKFLTNKKKKK
jgi:hypothetical protein